MTEKTGQTIWDMLAQQVQAAVPESVRNIRLEDAHTIQSSRSVWALARKDLQEKGNLAQPSASGGYSKT